MGSPRYFESHGKPTVPGELQRHECINICMGSSGVYRWEFDKADESLAIAVNGPLVVNDMEMSILAAIDSVGLAYSFEEYVAPLALRQQ